MKRVYAVAAMMMIAAMPTAASAMTAGEFLAKVKNLKSKGIFAIGSSDIGLLKAEMKGITTDYRNDIIAAKRQGRTPPSCPPPKDDAKAKMSSNDFMADLEAIPPAQRGVSMKTAFYAIMKKRFPCPAVG